MLTPGAVMLGAPGVCYECGHEHGVGDRCTAFHFAPALWEEIVAAVPGAKQSQVTRPQLPPLEILAPLFAEAEAARDEDDREAFEEIALRLAGTVVGILADAPKRARAAERPRYPARDRDRARARGTAGRELHAGRAGRARRR